MKISKSLFGNAAIYSISNILNGALPFFLLPILTRLLPPQEYGILAMYTVLLGIMGAFTGLSVHAAVNSRYVDRNEINFSNYVGSSLWVLCFSTLVTLLFTTVLQNPISKLISMSPFWLFMSIGASFATFVIQIRLGIWLMARKSIQYGGFQVGMSCINVMCSLALVLWVSRSADGRLWGQTLAMWIFGGLAFLSLWRDGLVDMRLNWKYIGEIFRFGIPLIPHIVGAFLLATADRWIVNERLGLHEAGVYMVAAQLGMCMGVMSDAFNKAFIPWLYEKLKVGGERNLLLIVRGTWMYFGVALCAAAIVAVLAPWIILLCAGEAYREATGALKWIAFAHAFSGMYLMVTNYVFYTRKTGLLGWFTLISGGVGVGVSWLLVPVLGVAGAGAGLAIGTFVKFLLTWTLAHRLCPMPWFSWSGKLTT